MLSNIEDRIISALAYFSIFDFPLTEKELYKYSNASSGEMLRNALVSLIEEKRIFNADIYYGINAEVTTHYKKRIKGEQRREMFLNKVKRRSKLISKFPFVRAVFISGTFSKGIFFKEDDVDFFIITQSDRLWLCRSFLILFKKIFLFNSRKFFCVNYFVDTNNLVIPDKNLFTATEIVTLLPMCGGQICEDFLRQNDWVKNYYPNFTATPQQLQRADTGNRIVEFLFSNSIGDVMENRLKNFTINTWKRKFPKMNKEELDAKLRSKDGVSKHHPKGYQEKVLEKHRNILEGLEIKTSLT